MKKTALMSTVNRMIPKGQNYDQLKFSSSLGAAATSKRRLAAAEEGVAKAAKHIVHGSVD